MKKSSGFTKSSAAKPKGFGMMETDRDERGGKSDKDRDDKKKGRKGKC